MSGYSTVQDHHSMFFDDLRNNYYSEAIKNAVNKDSVVLDLGAGLGLHGFIAAKKGARKVYLVEPESIIDVANQLVKANNFSDQVECIQGKIEEISLPEKVDIIISVFTGNFLLTEDLLPSLFYARDKYLHPGGKLIPDRASMEVVPVSVTEHYAEHINFWTNDIHDLDFSLVRSFATNSMYYDFPEKRITEFLSDPVEILDLDFMSATEASCRSQTRVEISQNGLCHGWLGWFKMRLGDSWLSTSPLQKKTHWRQVFLPLAEPVLVKKGDYVSLKINRPEFGEWTWTTEIAGTRQHNSTFLSAPRNPLYFQKKSANYNAILSIKGQAARDVLSKLDGSHSTAHIATRLLITFPQLFPNVKEAEKFVRSLVEKFA